MPKKLKKTCKIKFLLQNTVLYQIDCSFMAVPKKKTSKSKRNMRRSHHNHKPINVIISKDGVPSLPGQIALDGTYGGKQIIVKKQAKIASSEE